MNPAQCKYTHVLYIVFGALLFAFASLAVQSVETPNSDTGEVIAWRWFEDAHFNIRFQYPPNWDVQKIETTKYEDYSHCGLGGEDAADSNSDTFRHWTIVLEKRETRTNGHPAPPIVLIEQPDRQSSVRRTASPLLFTNESLIARMSLFSQEQQEGDIQRTVAVKSFKSGLELEVELQVSVRDQAGSTVLLEFTQVLQSLQLLNQSRTFDVREYRQPVVPARLPC